MVIRLLVSTTLRRRLGQIHGLSVNAISLLRNVLAEDNANSKVICDYVSLAMKLWQHIDSFQCLESNEGEKDCLTDTSIPLLLKMSEFLAFKGFTYLQSKLHDLVPNIFYSCKKMGFEECSALLWRENRLSHALCCASFSENNLSILIQKFGIVFKQILGNCVKDNLGYVLEFQ